MRVYSCSHCSGVYESKTRAVRCCGIKDWSRHRSASKVAVRALSSGSHRNQLTLECTAMEGEVANHE